MNAACIGKLQTYLDSLTHVYHWNFTEVETKCLEIIQAHQSEETQTTTDGEKTKDLQYLCFAQHNPSDSNNYLQYSGPRCYIKAKDASQLRELKEQAVDHLDLKDLVGSQKVESEQTVKGKKFVVKVIGLAQGEDNEIDSEQRQKLLQSVYVQRLVDRSVTNYETLPKDPGSESDDEENENKNQYDYQYDLQSQQAYYIMNVEKRIEERKILKTLEYDIPLSSQMGYQIMKSVAGYLDLEQSKKFMGINRMARTSSYMAILDNMKNFDKLQKKVSKKLASKITTIQFPEDIFKKLLDYEKTQIAKIEEHNKNQKKLSSHIPMELDTPILGLPNLCKPSEIDELNIDGVQTEMKVRKNHYNNALVMREIKISSFNKGQQIEKKPIFKDQDRDVENFAKHWEALELGDFPHLEHVFDLVTKILDKSQVLRCIAQDLTSINPRLFLNEQEQMHMNFRLQYLNILDDWFKKATNRNVNQEIKYDEDFLFLMEESIEQIPAFENMMTSEVDGKLLKGFDESVAFKRKQHTKYKESQLDQAENDITILQNCKDNIKDTKAQLENLEKEEANFKADEDKEKLESHNNILKTLTGTLEGEEKRLSQLMLINHDNLESIRARRAEFLIVRAMYEFIVWQYNQCAMNAQPNSEKIKLLKQKHQSLQQYSIFYERKIPQMYQHLKLLEKVVFNFDSESKESKFKILKNAGVSNRLYDPNQHRKKADKEKHLKTMRSLNKKFSINVLQNITQYFEYDKHSIHKIRLISKKFYLAYMQELFRTSSMIKIRLDDYNKEDVEKAKSNVHNTLSQLYDEVKESKGPQADEIRNLSHENKAILSLFCQEFRFWKPQKEFVTKQRCNHFRLYKGQTNLRDTDYVLQYRVYDFGMQRPCQKVDQFLLGGMESFNSDHKKYILRLTNYIRYHSVYGLPKEALDAVKTEMEQKKINTSQLDKFYKMIELVSIYQSYQTTELNQLVLATEQLKDYSERIDKFFQKFGYPKELAWIDDDLKSKIREKVNDGKPILQKCPTWEEIFA